MEYFLDVDFDNNWFIIPTDKEAEWDELMKEEKTLHPEDYPSWLKPIKGDYRRVKFRNYSII